MADHDYTQDHLPSNRERVQDYIKKNITDGKDPLFHNLPDMNDRIRVVDPETFQAELSKPVGKITGSDFASLYTKVMSAKKDFLICFNEPSKYAPTLVLVHSAGTFEDAVKRVKESGRYGDPLMLSDFESLTI